jgi:hypothetical protein
MKVPVPLSKEEKKEAKLMAVIVVLIYTLAWCNHSIFYN